MEEFCHMIISNGPHYLKSMKAATVFASLLAVASSMFAYEWLGLRFRLVGTAIKMAKKRCGIRRSPQLMKS
jgi:hypothetical protein